MDFVKRIIEQAKPLVAEAATRAQDVEQALRAHAPDVFANGKAFAKTLGAAASSAVTAATRRKGPGPTP